MPLKKNIFEAMFDVRPVRSPGVVDLEKIQNVKASLNLKQNLRKPFKSSKPIEKPPVSMLAVSPDYPISNNPINSPLVTETVQSIPESLSQDTKISAKDKILEEFEKAISETVDIKAVLTSIGGQLYYHPVSANRIRRRPIWRQNKNKITHKAQFEAEHKIERFWNFQPAQPGLILPNQNEPATDYVWPVSSVDRPSTQNFSLAFEPEPILTAENDFASSQSHLIPTSEVDFWIKQLKQPDFSNDKQDVISQNEAIDERIETKKKSKINAKILLPAVIAVAGFLLVYKTLNLRNNILEDGNKALVNLQQAESDLSKFDFSNAAESFILAYDNFNNAASTLDNLGASFLSSFEGFPGLDKVKSANNLINAGQDISKAGKNLALAFDTLSKTNFFSFFQQLDGGNQSTRSKQSLLTILSDFKQVLVFADKNITKATQLLANIEVASLPIDKQQLLTNFKEKIPAFQEYIGNAIDYSDFLLGAVGDKAPKKYIILLQNNSELRATGGFPGTYAVVTFNQGYLKNILVDDVYNIDGQIKQNIIPPKPLQHITPNWGMRDANWFPDFPTSARKVEDMYLKDGGEPVDGVLAVTPDVIGKILSIVGPIEMPEYGLTITADNFMYQIQSEVEYGENRAQPKTIVKELQPKLFAKLAEQDKDHWSEIFKSLTQEAEEKHILMYFNDPDLEKVAQKNGLAGDVKSVSGNYLQVILSNVKGSKTDAVVKNSFELAETMDSQNINHILTINRLHAGGNSKFGFYNKVNPSYIRVYVPKGAIIKNISGNTITDYRALIGHKDFGFTEDPDLALMEQNTKHPFKGVDVYEESGKTVFGFWLVVKPQESKSVTLTYQTSGIFTENNYELLWQKQAGTNQDQIDYNFEIPEGKRATGISENLQAAGNKIFMSSDLSIDREITIELK